LNEFSSWPHLEHKTQTMSILFPQNNNSKPYETHQKHFGHDPIVAGTQMPQDLPRGVNVYDEVGSITINSNI